jgi:phospholipid/cholesterol/gamma-HCH transport system substrate-binding protein
VKLSGEFKVGLLTVVAGVLLYLGFNYLKGIDFLNPVNTYYVVYRQIDGLTVSNPVQINGLSVGRVSKIEILQQQDNQLLVSIDVEKNIQLTDATVAMLSDGGLLGDKKITLFIKPGSRILSTKDTLLADAEGGLTAALMSKATPALESLDSTLINLNKLIKEYQGISNNIKVILDNTAQASGQASQLLADNRQQLNTITRNLSTLSGSLVETEKSVKPLLVKFNTLADSLNSIQMASTIQKANASLANIEKTIASINAGQGTLGQLATNDSLYHTLNKTMGDLDSLFIDLKRSPKRYVHFSIFGRRDRK